MLESMQSNWNSRTGGDAKRYIHWKEFGSFLILKHILTVLCIKIGIGYISFHYFYNEIIHSNVQIIIFYVFYI